MGIPGFTGDQSAGPTIQTYRAINPAAWIDQRHLSPQQLDGYDDTDEELDEDSGDETSDDVLEGDDESVDEV